MTSRKIIRKNAKTPSIFSSVLLTLCLLVSFAGSAQNILFEEDWDASCVYNRANTNGDVIAGDVPSCAQWDVVDNSTNNTGNGTTYWSLVTSVLDCGIDEGTLSLAADAGVVSSSCAYLGNALVETLVFTTVTIPLTGYDIYTLEFEWKGLAEDANDYFTVQYSSDGGATYQDVEPTQYSNNGGVVETASINLTSLAGQTINLGFNWIQDAISTTGLPDPVSIDNIFIYGDFGVVAKFDVEPELTCVNAPVQLTDQSVGTVSGWTWSANPSTGVTFSDPNAQNPTVTFANPGTYDITLDIQGTGVTDSETQFGVITVQADQLLPLSTNFNTGIPNDWAVVNPDQNIGWSTGGVTNIDGGVSAAARVNGFNYTAGAGQEDYLITPPMDLSSYDSVFLSFEHAYAGDAVNVPFLDSMLVQVSTDCGVTWATILEMGDDGTGTGNYATAPPTPNALFTPGAPEDWCGNGSYGPDCVMKADLTQFAGNENVKVRWVLLSAPSNDSWLDNILIEGVSSEVQANFTAEPLVTCVGAPVQFLDASSGNVATWDWDFPGGTPDSSDQQDVTVVYNTAGVYDVELIVCDGSGDCDTLLREDYITVLDNQTLPFFENWEGNNFTDNNWTVSNPDGDISWDIATVGGDNSGDKAAFMDHWDYTAVGERDWLITPGFDLNGFDSVSLSFDHAYAADQVSPVSDTLIIQVSTDCGGTWIEIAQIFDGGGFGYSTTTTLMEEFVPATEDDWCYGESSSVSCYSFDLKPYVGVEGFKVRIGAGNNNGNNAYVDNILIEGFAAGLPNANFTAGNTLFCPNRQIQFTDLSSGAPTSWNWQFPGGTPASSTTQNPTVVYDEPGRYTVTLEVTNGVGTDIEVKQGYMTITNGFSLPIIEGFETSETFNNRGWSLVNDEGDNTWEIVTTGGTTPGTKSLKLDVFNNTGNAGTEDYFVSPPLDFTDWDSISFTFEHAYQPGVLASPETLKVELSQDCGDSWSNLVTYVHTGTGTFGTTAPGSGEFTPAQESDWCISGNTNTPCTFVDLSQYVGQDQLRIRFVGVNGGGNNIYIDNVNISGFYVGREPVAKFISEYPIACVGNPVKFFDISENDPDSYKWTFNGGDPSTSTRQVPVVTYNQAGLYPVGLIASNFFGSDTVLVADYIKVVEPRLLPFYEDFESGDFATQDWYTQNPGGGIKWEIQPASGNGGSLAAKMNHRDYFSPIGARDFMVSPPFDFRAYDSVFFDFEHAYQVFSTNSIDSLFLSYTTDCGNSWTRIATYADDGNGSHATTLPSQSAFMPTQADDWCISGPYGAGCYSLDLTDIVTGFNNVKFRFETYNENGNNQYIDNISITGVSSAPTADFTSDITVVCENDSVLFSNTSTTNATDFVWYFEGGSVDSVFTREPGYITYDSSGVYEVNLYVSNPFGTDSELRPTYIQVIESPSLSFTVVPAGCGQSNGSATVNVSGGIGPFSYVWDRLPADTNATLSDAVGGTYHVTVTGANGCVTEGDVLIHTSGNMQASIIDYAGVSCNGAQDGLLEAKGSQGLAPYTYEWNTGDLTPRIEDLPGGTYTCIIRDAAGCVQSVSVTVAESDVLQLAMSATDDDGSTNGTASTTVTGGTAPFTYAWNNGADTPNLDSLAQGLYSVTVTDANGCSVSGQVVVTYNPDIEIVLVNKTNVSCNGQNDGEITISVNGGTAPYNYQWNTNPPQFTATATGLGVGNYTVTVIDNLGVTETMTYFVSEEAPIVLNASATDDNGTQSGTATATVFSGGIPPYSFEWSTNPPQQTASISNLREGFYTVTVTDSVGCTASQTVQVVGTYAPLDVNQQGINHVTCFGDNDGSIQSIANGGVQPYSYVWNTTPTQFGQTATNLPGGTYTCVVTDAYGNQDSVVVTVNQPQQLLCLMSATKDNGPGDGSATVVPTGGTPFAGNTYNYQWNTNPPQLTPTATGLVYGTYTVIVTDRNGCECSGTIEVEKNFSIEEELEKRIKLFPNPNDGVFSLNVDLTAASDIKLHITNNLGEVIMVREYSNLSNSTLNLDLSNQPKGMYNLRLMSENWEHNTRFIISK